jgi:acetyl esterase/lipase
MRKLHACAWLLLAAPLLAACSPLRAISALSSTAHLEATQGVAYGAHPRQQLDLYVPERNGADTAAPIVVFFYGGAWQRGNRADYAFVGSFLAAQGIIAVIPDYRLYPEVGFPDFVHDGAAAVAWVTRNIADFGGDPSRIVLMGHSAGAHIAALLALDAHYLEQAGVSYQALEALIALAGPFDFAIDEGRLARIFAAAADSGASQPLNFVNADAPPALLLHGADDGVVEPANSRRLHRSLCEAGVDAELVIYPGVGHVRVMAALAPPLSFVGRSSDAVADFLARRVGAHGGDAAEAMQGC